MRLNTDNRDTMPVTDAVYGKKPFVADRKERTGSTGRQLWQALTADGLTALRNLGGKETKRFFAIRSKEQS